MKENWVVHIWKGALVFGLETSGPEKLHRELSTVLLDLLLLGMRKTRGYEERPVLRTT